MNCQKCGKTMPNGARFCISCGAEHDANGQLVGGSKGKVDYNKTVMANDAFVQSGGGSKVDYNKTVMANDAFLQSNRPKVDYNKTMMANDVPQVNPSQNHNQRNNVNQSKNPSANSKQIKKNKKVSPVLIIVLLLLSVAVAFKVALPMLKKKKEPVVSDAIITESTTKAVEETTETGNVVEDFDSSAGYWSEDNEFFYKGGTKVKNAWQGDYYLGEDGRKVRNKLIDNTFYVDANGKKIKNQWYRFTKKIGSSEVIAWYYMGPDGAKLRDTFTPDGYYVDVDGIYIADKVNDTPDAPKYNPNKK